MPQDVSINAEENPILILLKTAN